MWPENTRGWRQRWFGFRDPLGERVVVETVSGIRSQGLIVAPDLTPDAGALSLLHRSVAEATDVRHPALRSPRSVQRLERRHAAVILSDYSPGVRLGAWLDERRGAPPPTSTILYVVRQVAAALRAYAEHAPGLFHGAVNLDRIVVVPDGRVFLVEPGIGPLLAAQDARDAEDWWTRFHLPVPFTGAPPFGLATDACQLGVVALELLIGRRLGPGEFPGAVARLLGAAEETDLVGDRTPLGGPLFEWISLAIGLDVTRDAPSIAIVADALDELLGDDGTYVAAPVGLTVDPPPLEPWPFTTSEETAEDPATTLAPQPAAAAAGGRDAWVTSERMPTSMLPALPAPEVEVSTSAAALLAAPSAWRESAHDRDAGDASTDAGIEDRLVPAASGLDRPSRRRARVRPGPTVAARQDRDWRTTARYGTVAVVITVLAAAGAAGWRYWRDLNIGQQTGTVVVDSQPSGAAILIDGIERGKAPLSVAVTPGRHEVMAKSATGLGRATVDVTLGARHDVKVPLVFGTDPGHVDINTDPAGARVLLDGVARGRSPLSLTEVSPGEHVLQVEEGAARLERRFTLAPAERLSIYVPLAGWLSVRARVPLEVFDRGQPVGSSRSRLLVPAGRRRLQFVNAEFGVNTTQDVVVMAGQSASLSIPLTDGVLSVSADVVADVQVDGQSAGVTPTGNMMVPIGEHEVLVSHPRWGDQRLTVIVGLGEPTRLKVKLLGATGTRSPNQRSSPKRSGISAAR